MCIFLHLPHFSFSFFRSHFFNIDNCILLFLKFIICLNLFLLFTIQMHIWTKLWFCYLFSRTTSAPRIFTFIMFFRPMRPIFLSIFRIVTRIVTLRTVSWLFRVLWMFRSATMMTSLILFILFFFFVLLFIFLFMFFRWFTLF